MGRSLSLRQDAILSVVRREGSVQVSALAAELGVSQMTIRRDLSALVLCGAVERVHGAPPCRGPRCRAGGPRATGGAAAADVPGHARAGQLLPLAATDRRRAAAAASLGVRLTVAVSGRGRGDRARAEELLAAGVEGCY
ncbi:DeoR family transcriptional regulator [Streptomyces sp. M19]